MMTKKKELFTRKISKAEQKRNQRILAIQPMFKRLSDHDLEIYGRVYCLVDKGAKVVIGSNKGKPITVPAEIVQRAAYQEQGDRSRFWSDPQHWKPFIVRAELACVCMGNNSDGMFRSILRNLTGQDDAMLDAILPVCTKMGGVKITMDAGGVPSRWVWVDAPKPATDQKKGA